MQLFSPILGLSVHFLDCIVGSTKVLNFDDVQLMYISFAPCAFGVMFKKAFPSPRSQRLTPVFSSKNFIVLVSTFMFMIYLECIFMFMIYFESILDGVEEFTLIFLFQHYLLKLISFPPLNHLGTLFRNQLAINAVVYF